MGENRQRYLDKLQERLKNRKKKISDAEYDEEEEEEGLDEDLSETSGNVLLDLQKRFEKEKEALLRRLQVIRNAGLTLFDMGGGHDGPPKCF